MLRILYRRSDNFVILLHAFVKTTQKIPPGEIGEAEKN
jgi:phage-related protein